MSSHTHRFPAIAGQLGFVSLLALLLTGCQSTNSSEELASNRDLDSLLEKAYSDSLEAYQAPDEFFGLVKQEWGDLDSIIARRLIRVVVPYSLTYYYVDGTQRKGIAFDMIKLFEKKLNEELKFNPPRIGVVFIPVNRERVIPMVSQGYGDIGVGGFEDTSRGIQDVDKTEPMLSGLRHIIVGAKTAPAINSITDLAGKEVFVRRGSDYEVSLVAMSDSLKKMGHAAINIKEIDPYFEIEDVLQLVNSGVIPYAVCYERVAKLWDKVLDGVNLYSNVALKEKINVVWVVRKNAPRFKEQVDKFVSKNHIGTATGNMLYARYVTNPDRLKHLLTQQNQKQFFDLSTTFRKYGGEYSLDWVLLAAQGYQESRLDQKAVSPVGAVGIMQVMPFVAVSKPINIPNIQTTENNIHAGTKVMRYLIDTFFDDAGLDSLNQHLLALAAYNAGPTRIKRLRKEAMSRGLDPNIWFDNVETVVAQRVGREPVNYVSNIYKYYTSFKALTVYANAKREHQPVGN
jgi:membrane-bound lytic murein transglycosylase MltF